MSKWPPGSKSVGRLGHQPLDHLRAAGTGQQGHPRLELPHVGCQTVQLGRRDVGRIADDEVELPLGRHRREQIAFENSIRSATPCCWALSLATASAAGLMSIAVTRQLGRCLARQTAMMPLPVPTSAIEGLGIGDW